ncbi:MAG: lanthionine synthetase LanC family protein [Candidatus Kariarchaeaceae archaeon]|jgi:hypothetical protein
MKITSTTSFIFVLLIVSSFSNSSGLVNHISERQVYTLSDINSGLKTDQTSSLSSEDLILDTINILLSKKNDTGSWSLSTISSDPRVHYGLAGGIAGIGMKLLEALDYNIIKVNTTTSTMLLGIADEIGQELISVGDINASYALWNVTDSDNLVDLGWDFGLAGISAFFSSLFNHTENIVYQEVAIKAIMSIQDLVNSTNGSHWESQLYNFTSALGWYNPIDKNNIAAYDDKKMVFSGISLGTAGIAKSALAYISQTSDGSNIIANSVLNSSIAYLDSIAIVEGNNRSFLVAEEFDGFKFTNIANGMSGIAKLYTDLFVYTANSTYKNYALEILNWLNGTTNDFDSNPVFRFTLVYEVNDVLLTDRELGYTHGSSGVMSSLFEIGQLLANDTALSMSEQLSSEIYGFRIDSGEFTQIPDQSIEGQNPEITTSWAFGMSGTFVSLFEIAEHFGQAQSKERLAEMKNYLMSQVTEMNGSHGIKTSSTSKIEIHPSIGLPGFLEMLSLKTKGKLHVEENDLAFDKTEIGNTNSKSILLQNLGESSIDISWNTSMSTDTFSSTISNMTLDSLEDYLLEITFLPSIEEISSDLWVITDDAIDFALSLSGQGFDLPNLNLVSTVENGTFVESHKTIDFTLTVTDSSDISSVSVQFGDTIDTLTIDSTTQTYSVSVNTNPLSNGTYSLVFSATDVLTNTGSVVFEFDLGVYSSDLVDEAVSDTTRNILIGVGVVLLVVAVFVTRRYMK